jgi:hypothetical protein
MVVYLLHFDRPYQHAKHYLGSCQDLERRLTQHGKGRGARLLEVVHAVGIGWVAYLLAADNCRGPLVNCVSEVNQPVVRSRIRFSAPRSRLLACL